MREKHLMRVDETSEEGYVQAFVVMVGWEQCDVQSEGDRPAGYISGERFRECTFFIENTS